MHIPLLAGIDSHPGTNNPTGVYDSNHMFFCPEWKYEENYGGSNYGKVVSQTYMGILYRFNCAISLNEDRGRSKVMKLRNIKIPSAYVFALDGRGAYKWGNNDAGTQTEVDEHIFYRHEGRVNALYYDGHVKGFNSIPLYTDVQWTPKY